jgi:14-3-3 protein epsilon
MMDIMSSLAKLDMELTMEERNLLLVGYKKVTAAKCTSLHALSHIEVAHEEDGNANNMNMITNFHHKVEVELNKLCYNVIHTIDTDLLPYSSDAKCDVPLSLA